MSGCPYDLRIRYQQGRVIPFVGAGVSMSPAMGRAQRRGSPRAVLVGIGRQGCGTSGLRLDRDGPGTWH